ncbi:hypothetical protein MKEN_00415000 [Mycena kentingensis (nom. inval.)]|nr:hypothetical protein MKEN_00415000 [Mycena kentingensis (nom. inval.)]
MSSSASWLLFPHRGPPPPAFHRHRRRCRLAAAPLPAGYYIIGVLLALGLVLAFFLIWARWRFPVGAIRRVPAPIEPERVATTLEKPQGEPFSTRPVLFDVYLSHVADAGTVLWCDMQPLSFAALALPLPTHSIQHDEYAYPNKARASESPSPSPPPPATFSAHIAAMIAMPSPWPHAESFDFAVGTAELEI